MILKDMDEFGEDPYEKLDRMKIEESILSFESMILLSFRSQNLFGSYSDISSDSL